MSRAIFGQDEVDLGVHLALVDLGHKAEAEGDGFLAFGSAVDVSARAHGILAFG